MQPRQENLIDGATGPWEVVIGMEVHAQVTSKSKLSVFYSRTHTNSPYSRIVQGDGLPPVITDGRGNYDWVHTTRANFDYTLAPTLLLHLGAGYVNFTLRSSQGDPGANVRVWSLGGRGKLSVFAGLFRPSSDGPLN